MSQLLSLLLATGALMSTVSCSELKCELHWHMADGVCFRTFSNRVSYSKAKSSCQRNDGHLAKIRDWVDARRLGKLINTTPYRSGWVGAEKVGGSLIWIADQTDVEFRADQFSDNICYIELMGNDNADTRGHECRTRSRSVALCQKPPTCDGQNPAACQNGDDIFADIVTTPATVTTVVTTSTAAANSSAATKSKVSSSSTTTQSVFVSRSGINQNTQTPSVKTSSEAEISASDKTTHAVTGSWSQRYQFSQTLSIRDYGTAPKTEFPVTQSRSTATYPFMLKTSHKVPRLKDRITDWSYATRRFETTSYREEGIVNGNEIEHPTSTTEADIGGENEKKTAIAAGIGGTGGAAGLASIIYSIVRKIRKGASTVAQDSGPEKV